MKMKLSIISIPGQSGEEDTKGNSETSDNEDSEDEEQAMKRIIKQVL